MSCFSVRERVRFRDVDAAKVMYYGAYIRFLELAETEMFRAVGVTQARLQDEFAIWLPRVHIECDYEAAIQLDEEVDVQVHVARLGESSMQLAFEILRVSDNMRMATAKYVTVAVDRDTFAKVPMPAELRRLLTPFLAD